MRMVMVVAAAVAAAAAAAVFLRIFRYFLGDKGIHVRINSTYRVLANKPHKFHPTIAVGGYRADGAYKVRFNVVAMLVF